MTTCGKTFLYLHKRVLHKHVYALVPALCKTWACPTCREKKAKIVQRFIEKSFQGQPCWLLSLTFFHKGAPEDTWKNIGKICGKMLSYARKMSGTFEYVRVVEVHKDGIWPHVHILVNKPICTENFVRLLTKWGFGWSFHAKPLNSQVASKYLSKYLTKPWPGERSDEYRYLAKTRIVSASRSLGSIFASSSDWRVVTYDNDIINLEFYYNLLINLLHQAKATVICSQRSNSGWIVETDVDLPDNAFEMAVELYYWRFDANDVYRYYPYGLQESCLS